MCSRATDETELENALPASQRNARVQPLFMEPSVHALLLYMRELFLDYLFALKSRALFVSLFCDSVWTAVANCW